MPAGAAGRKPYCSLACLLAGYHNVVANPTVTLEVDGETFEARATPLAGGPERDRLYAQHAVPMPAFLEYQKKTERNPRRRA